MIDVKELRVGSHVLADRERKWVKSASCPWIFLDDDKAYHKDELEPIPLTAELLTEIGFVCRPRELAKDRVKNFFIDAESAKIMEETRLCFPQIELSYYGEIGEPELWRVRILYNSKSTFSNANLATEAEITIRDLHELENFVYMTLHKELIED